MWETSSGQQLRTLKGYTDAVWACALSPDGRFIASANGDKIRDSKDNTLRIWDVTSSQPLRLQEGHTRAVIACAFSPDGRFIVSASADNTVRVWGIANGNLLHTLQGHTNWVNAVRSLRMGASSSLPARTRRCGCGRPPVVTCCTPCKATPTGLTVCVLSGWALHRLRWWGQNATVVGCWQQ